MFGFKVAHRRRSSLALAALVLLAACRSLDLPKGCGSGKEASSSNPGAASASRPPGEELINRWDSLRSATDDDMTKMARQRLDNAVNDTDAFSTIMAAQLLEVGGDVRAAKTAADSAAMKFPQEDSPHYFLAKLYYKLAIFDAVDRHVYRISTLPLSESTKDGMDQATRIEIDELTNPRTTAYRALLKDVGITEPQTLALRLYMIDPNKVIGPNPGPAIQQMIDKIGLPTVFPIITLTPDARNAEILGWVKRELDTAAVKNPTPTPEGVGLIDRTEMAAIQQRVNGLLNNVSAESQNTSPNSTEDTGETVHYAAENGDLGRVQALLSRGAPVDEKDSHGKTALIYAARNGHVEIVQLLLSKGANIELEDSVAHGTPLIWAAYGDQEAVVRLLIQHGANINATTVDGMTALDAAIHTGATRAEATLRAFGANGKPAEGPIELLGLSKSGMILLENRESYPINGCTITLSGGFKVKTDFPARGDPMALLPSEFKRDDGSSFSGGGSEVPTIISERCNGN